MGLLSGIVFLTFIAMVKCDECQEKGQYKTEAGFCCQLCSAGCMKADDCSVDGGHPFCPLCTPRQNYMDVTNNASECKVCSNCSSAYEEVEELCSVTRDTVCRCQQGYRRAQPSLPCIFRPDAGKIAGISASLVIGIVLVVVSALYLRKKLCRHEGEQVTSEETERITLRSVDTTDNSYQDLQNFIKENMSSSRADVWRRMDETLPDVWKSLRSKTFLLYALYKATAITQPVYWEACGIADNTTRADFILNHFVKGNEEKYHELLDVIYAGQNKPMQRMLECFAKCSPTLNPGSAHPGLNISSNLKTASRNGKLQGEAEGLQQCHQWAYVLSFESFCSGCHCWVVDVKTVENLRVGVAYGTTSQEGGDDACTMGCNSVSWCIQKNKGRYRGWHDRKHTELAVDEHPHRIGVGLDYDAGLLLFYNADNNKHLHTFYAHFRQPLHFSLYLGCGCLNIEVV